jgi:hypothetical protein
MIRFRFSGTQGLTATASIGCSLACRPTWDVHAIHLKSQFIITHQKIAAAVQSRREGSIVLCA